MNVNTLSLGLSLSFGYLCSVELTLFQKRFLFTNHLKHPEASAYSAPLDRAMRFLDKKLRSFGQYRSAEGIDPMLNA
jgi:hypothetical protein